MTNFDDRLELPPGEYQAEVAAVQTGEVPHNVTVIFFRLTEPGPDSKHPQAGMGGRIARAFLDLDDPNPRTAAIAKLRADELLAAVGVDRIDAAIGKVVRIRVGRTILRSDPSQYRIAVTEILPLTDPNVRPFVQ